jgi:hypothetical protein
VFVVCLDGVTATAAFMTFSVIPIVDCGDGDEPAATKDFCIPCSEGQAGTNGSCLLCANGMTPTLNRTSCQKCPQGTHGRDGVCVPCLSGTFAAAPGGMLLCRDGSRIVSV